MNKLLLVLRYFNYLLTSVNEHGIHSPFIYGFYCDLIKDKTPFATFEEIETLRKTLFKDKRSIQITDLGAGSSINPTKERFISDIARNTLKEAKYGQLLFKIVNRFKSKEILELGTSLGISSLYLSAPNSQSRLTTMEGCLETAKIARENFQSLNRTNINLQIGNFDDLLPEYLKFNTPDLVFIDGNHRYQPTIRYVESILKKENEHLILILDDIHWSSEMEKAWNEIRQFPEVRVSLDLFHLGILFFHKSQEKEHFVLRS